MVSGDLPHPFTMMRGLMMLVVWALLGSIQLDSVDARRQKLVPASERQDKLLAVEKQQSENAPKVEAEKAEKGE